MKLKDYYKCCICGKEERGYGNNPDPVDSHEKKCCDDCNDTVVIPARIKQLMGESNG